MADRPAYKSDIDDLRDDIVRMAEAASKTHKIFYDKLGDHALKIQSNDNSITNLTKRVDNVFKIVATILIGVTIALFKMFAGYLSDLGV